MIGQHNAAWETWFASAGIRPHRVSYEELDAGMAGVTLGIQDFLGLDAPDERVILPAGPRLRGKQGELANPVGAPSASLADLADAGLAALDRVPVGSGVAQPGDRFARCRFH